MDADAVLKRFNNPPQRQDEDAEIGEHDNGNSWPELRKILDAAVADKTRIEAKQLSQGLHLLQVNNELLWTQNEELQHKLNLIKKRPTQRTTLTTQESDDWHGGAVFYSPRKLASERARKAAELNEAAQLQLQKTRNREKKAAATAYQKQQQEEAKLARQRAAEERRKAKNAQAEALTAKRALKKLQRDAATAEKSRNTANTRKQKASHSAAKNPTKHCCVVAARSCVDAAPPAASPPPKITKAGRKLRLPAKYK
jgi:hypothetical protein